MKNETTSKILEHTNNLRQVDAGVGLRSWSNYPIGTKAHAVMGGYWIKTNHGWKWCTGATFPTPGGNVSRVEIPKAT